MNPHTLYFIQSDFNSTETTLKKLTSIYTAEDAVVLMGESVLLCTAALNIVPQIYILETEADNLIVKDERIHPISYAEFADLCLQFTRSIRLK